MTMGFEISIGKTMSFYDFIMTGIRGKVGALYGI
jgi:hypothetical protein